MAKSEQKQRRSPQSAFQVNQPQSAKEMGRSGDGELGAPIRVMVQGGDGQMWQTRLKTQPLRCNYPAYLMTDRSADRIGKIGLTKRRDRHAELNERHQRLKHPSATLARPASHLSYPGIGWIPPLPRQHIEN